jgi:hypothetical protein
MHNAKKNTMRRFFILSFSLLIFISLVLAFFSFKNREWETLTASVSLTIAIISGWIAYETFYRQALSEKPQIILRLDFKSRYDLILLVAENLGSKTAFNIQFKWDQVLLNLDGEKVTFNKYDTDHDITVLNPQERTSVIIDGQSQFFEKHKNEHLNYSGKIIFQESLNSKRKTSYPFKFSFDHYTQSLSFDSEEPRTMHELQKVPTKLNEIKEVLNKILEIEKKKPSA